MGWELPTLAELLADAGNSVNSAVQVLPVSHSHTDCSTHSDCQEAKTVLEVPSSVSAVQSSWTSQRGSLLVWSSPLSARDSPVNDISWTQWVRGIWCNLPTKWHGNHCFQCCKQSLLLLGPIYQIGLICASRSSSLGLLIWPSTCRMNGTNESWFLGPSSASMPLCLLKYTHFLLF